MSKSPKGQPMFDKIALIGIGLIGGSIALAARRNRFARKIVAATRWAETPETANRLKLVDRGTDLAAACEDADLVIVCTPVGACGEATRIIAPALKPGLHRLRRRFGEAGGGRGHGPHIPAGVHSVPAPPGRRHREFRPRGRPSELFDGRLDHPDALARRRSRRGRQARGVLEGAGQ